MIVKKCCLYLTFDLVGAELVRREELVVSSGHHLETLLVADEPLVSPFQSFTAKAVHVRQSPAGQLEHHHILNIAKPTYAIVIVLNIRSQVNTRCKGSVRS